MRKRKLWTLQSELVVSILQEKGIVQVKQKVGQDYVPYPGDSQNIRAYIASYEENKK